MATKRVPAQPPGLMGYDPIKLIGTGGYADVYLYEQQLPKRQVAVKVLIADALGGSAHRAAFTAEANLMARVSAHPYIVQIFQADIASDGRPYLVMEYYPGQNYFERAKRERMAVADVLRTGVQLASAVETAHVAGILHRDIKPANVLTSEFRRPGLTDFGIASAQGPQNEATEGLSIPWSPPESFGDGVLGVRADVYSLAATLYTLLCGRSPFEIPGGDNSGLSMISRIERNPVPPTGRTDVPASLERLLGQAMAKNPAHRPETAVAFARQLQQIESELKLGVTALELAAAEHQTIRTRDELPDDDSTRIKGIVEIQAQATPGHDLIDRVDFAPVSAAPVVREREGLLAEPAVDHTVHRSHEVPVARVEVSEPKRSRSLLIAAGTVLAVGAIGIGVAVANGGGSSADKPSTFDTVASGSKPTVTVAIVVPEQVAPFSGVADASGTFTFTWLGSNGAPSSYVVTEIGSTKSPVKVEDTKYTARTTCIEVETLAETGTLSAPVRGCAK